jgi:hypothetical protein
VVIALLYAESSRADRPVQLPRSEVEYHTPSGYTDTKADSTEVLLPDLEEDPNAHLPSIRCYLYRMQGGHWGTNSRGIRQWMPAQRVRYEVPCDCHALRLTQNPIA